MDEPLEQLLRRAYRYAVALTGDPVVAEDLVQDAWSSVLESNGPRTGPYLFRTVRNAWIDVVRRGRVVRFEALSEPVAGGAPTTGEAPELLAALGRLRMEEREALFLCAVEGYTAQEVSDRTGQPRGTVLSLIHRGRVRLRELLGMDEREVAR
jgi:RNA polymerase sigma-70 factor, ECF subfamily